MLLNMFWLNCFFVCGDLSNQHKGEFVKTNSFTYNLSEHMSGFSDAKSRHELLVFTCKYRPELRQKL